VKDSKNMSTSPDKPAEHAYIWEFRVSESWIREFEECYGPNGDWAALFRKSQGFLKTELVRDKTDPTRYLTIDYWQSKDAYSEFRSAFQGEYDELDKQCESLTVQEIKVGEFTSVR
jgi:heme-degrading monooxygenase HmoA